MFGFRVGVAEDALDDDVAVFGVVDLTGGITLADFLLDLAWRLGVRDAVLVSVPLSFGGTLRADGMRFLPCASPRLVLDALFGGARDDDLDLDVAVDLEMDLFFTPAWGTRVGGTLGGRDAVAAGVVS